MTKFERIRSLSLAGALAVLPVQTLAQGVTAPAPAPGQAAARPAAPRPNADPMAPLPVDGAISPEEALPPVWTMANVKELLAYIDNVHLEGLEPLDYDAAGLIRAMRSGDPPALNKAATERFNKLSSDLAFGHVRGADRQDWYVVDKDLDDARQRHMLEAALATNRIGAVLGALLPSHPQYGALKNALALADKTDTAKVNRIRLNMDRWRWLPRDLGDKYIIVNIPAFYATLVENGTTRWKQRAIAGATKTPTPQLSAMATGVILNPWWEVPKSIEPEVRGKAGFISVKGKDGKIQRWRQPPGPSNALGQMKMVMPNQWAIFLHDTNARSRFNSQVRALSHGCIRTQDIHDLAAELGSDDAGEWTREKIDEVLASKKTVEAKFVKPVPVYIVYFSSAALTDGTIVDYKDLYKRDGKVLAALLDRKAPAAATKAQTASR